jgi:uncharacterized protein (TIGR02594 family)
MVADKWLRVARSYLGVREFKGAQHNPIILGWLAKLGAWWHDDEQPWCGTFVGAVLKEAGINPAKAFYRAKAWLDWGVAVAPRVGAVVVFDRQGGGHVAFLLGKTSSGQLVCLGGNQGDEVSIRVFDAARVIGYRWPSTELLEVSAGLPVLAAAQRSEAEA